ncbi:hypothetical protein Pmani_010441 [Petrolisthes manimaculis]|uniref:Arginyl-tRNA--protein transferase 1 n=1 Tax=Petrolisthes manimaculis TaxID=1843537 RepID=A0AAE1Q264_9EUCA|nr:hypothetical protein Pmani_010441 [Petrolisthes manimaculis]
MSVGHYQELIDRGWRRSGQYSYKPTMEKICCPMYTIRCDALELKLSKTQKKVLKRMNRYLTHGDVKGLKSLDNDGSNSPIGGEEEYQFVRPRHKAKDLSSVNISPESLSEAKYSETKRDEMSVKSDTSHCEDDKDVASVTESESVSTTSDQPSSKRQDLTNIDNTLKVKKNIADPNRPPCRKAKEIRRERREAKLARRTQEAISRGESPMESDNKKAKTTNVEKSLEDFLNEPMPANPAHTLEVRLVRSQPGSTEFQQTAKMSCQVYQKYQVNIHHDTLDKCHEFQYRRFLCNSPLELKLVRVNPPEAAFSSTYNDSYAVFRKYQLEIHHDTESECDKMSYKGFLVQGPLSPWKPASGPRQGYGSFHHQYWLDGRLIAVGVLDVLPHSVSSVYLYYDPEFSFLSLGTYASLRELALTRELQRRTPALKWYYMGFYIHSCPKMRYKGRYTPSFLLCPETYKWFPIEDAVPKLDVVKYARFNEDLTANDENAQVDIKKIPVLHDQSLIPYSTYEELFPEDENEDEVKEYATLVGAKCAYSMFLCRS